MEWHYCANTVKPNSERSSNKVCSQNKAGSVRFCSVWLKDFSILTNSPCNQAEIRGSSFNYACISVTECCWFRNSSKNIQVYISVGTRNNMLYLLFSHCIRNFFGIFLSNLQSWSTNLKSVPCPDEIILLCQRDHPEEEGIWPQSQEGIVVAGSRYLPSEIRNPENILV